VETADLVKKELALNGFRAKRFLGVPYETLISEIAACLIAVHHERQIPPFGVLFCNYDLSNRDGVKVIDINPSPTEIQEARSLTDGSRTFLTYFASDTPRLAILDDAVSDELGLLDLATAVQGLAVKRDDSGLVRLVQDGQIWLVDNRQWLRKARLWDYMEQVESCLGYPPSTLILPLSSLLRLSYHFLSSQNIGTTLVWRVINESQKTMEGLSHRGIDVAELGLSVTDDSTYPILGHLLKYHDGAAIVSPEGEVEYIATHLTYGEDTARLVQPDRGTRHTSARRFSFEHEETIVYVVSQDGPVSVYSDGYKVAELASEMASRHADRLKKMVPSKAPDVESSVLDIRCKECGRSIRIEEVVVYGWKERESVNCPCCSAPDIYSSMCFSLTAHPVKFPFMIERGRPSEDSGSD